MARLSIVFGLLLCCLTVFGLVNSLSKNPMQFFPLMLGIPMLFCGVVALNPHRRRQSMAAAAAVSLLGATMGLGRLIHWGYRWIDGNTVNSLALILAIGVFAICGVFTQIHWAGIGREKRQAESETD